MKVSLTEIRLPLAFPSSGKVPPLKADEVVLTFCRSLKVVQKTYNNLITACGRSFSKLGEANERRLSQ